MMNIRQEVSIPKCLLNFRGNENKFKVESETQSYALCFGGMSKLDKGMLEIFKEFGAKAIEDKLVC